MKIVDLLKSGNIEEKDWHIFAEYREKYNSIPPYSPTKEEKEIIVKTTGIPGEWLDESIFKLMEPGKIDVRTHKSTWMALMGGNYLVDIDAEEAYLISEN